MRITTKLALAFGTLALLPTLASAHTDPAIKERSAGCTAYDNDQCTEWQDCIVYTDGTWRCDKTYKDGEMLSEWSWMYRER